MSLRRELMQAGSHRTEADELLLVASRLSGAASAIPGLSRVGKDAIAVQIGFKPLRTGRRNWLLVSSAFAACLVFVLLAQTALPGEPLYALKRGSEQVRVAFDPGFTKTIVARRKTELDSLKQDNASHGSVERAEQDYQKSLLQSSKIESSGGSGKSGGEGTTLGGSKSGSSSGDKGGSSGVDEGSSTQSILVPSGGSTSSGTTSGGTLNSGSGNSGNGSSGSSGGSGTSGSGSSGSGGSGSDGGTPDGHL